MARTVQGAPAQTLLGLWLFMDGSAGDALTQITDLSGNGNHAILKAGWEAHAPIRQSYGVEVASADGTIFETPVAMNQPGGKLTVVIASRSTLPGLEVNVFNTLMGSSLNEVGSDPGAFLSTVPEPCLLVRGTYDPAMVKMFDDGGDIWGDQNLQGSEGDYADHGEAGVVAFDIDAEANTVKLHSLGAPTTSAMHAGVGAHYDGSSDRGTLEIGTWARGGARSAVSSIGQIHAAAAYADSFDPEAAQQLMASFQRIVALRGVTYPG